MAEHARCGSTPGSTSGWKTVLSTLTVHYGDRIAASVPAQRSGVRDSAANDQVACQQSRDGSDRVRCYARFKGAERGDCRSEHHYRRVNERRCETTSRAVMHSHGENE
jgi:hypothetical protein